MAGIAKILDAVHSKLHQESEVLVRAYIQLDKFMKFFEGTDKISSLEFENLILKTRIFINHTSKLLQEYAKITESVKKVSKKLSATPDDVASHTERIETTTEKVKLLNVEGETLVRQAEILAKNYLVANK